MASTVSQAISAASLRLSSSHRRLPPSPPAVSLIGSRVQFGRLIQRKKPLGFDRRIGGEIALRCSAVTTIGESEFSGEVLGSEVPVLVEFVAEWCGPCRLISPVIEWASQEYKDKLKIVKIDHDANPQLIEEHKVYGLPCLILFKDGKEVPESRREGAITKVKLKEYLDSLLGSTTVV